MGKVEIEWALLDVEASRIYSEPERQLLSLRKKDERAGVSVCPAVLSQLSNSYTVQAPFTFALRFTGSIENPEVRLIQDASSIALSKFKPLFTLSPRSDWLDANYPVFQITTPYVFRSKENCHMLQRFPRALVGHGYPFRLIEGRFSISKWIRPLSWAVEWIKPEEDIVVKRGDPWFDLQYFANDLDSSFVLRKSDLDDSFQKSLRSSQNITSYVTGTGKWLR